MLVYLEGNIASGKTTVGQALTASDTFTFIPEPVEQWQTRFPANMLERFYHDMPRWSFTFQICTFFTRVQALAGPTATPYVVAERSIGTDRHVFAPALHRQGAMDDLEWDLYRQFWEALSPHVPQPDAILYLRTPAEECLRRLQHRHRQEETGVTLEYLQRLEALHDAWLLDHPRVIVLDGRLRWTADQIRQQLENFLAP